MEIVPAKESDIIEALYIIKVAFDSNNLAKNYWRPPVPDYEKLKTEINQNNLFMIRDKNVSIGTISFADDFPDMYKKIEWKAPAEEGLFIKRIAIVPSWMKEELKPHIQEFIDNYARNNNFTSVKLNVYSTNEEMNKFYEQLGFDLRNETKTSDFESPFNYYEKILQ